MRETSRGNRSRCRHLQGNPDSFSTSQLQGHGAPSPSLIKLLAKLLGGSGSSENPFGIVDLCKRGCLGGNFYAW